MSLPGTRRPLCAAVALLLAPLLATALRAQTPAELVEVHRMLPANRGDAFAHMVGDVDDDGDPDVALFGVRRNEVWRRAGNGRLVALPGAFPPLGTDERAQAIGDLDGDGDLDCVLWQTPQCQGTGPACFNGALRVLFNDGGGHLGGGAPLPTDPQAIPGALALGDVDLDGDLDVVVGCVPHVWPDFQVPPNYTIERGQNLLFVNDGTGTFTAQHARLGADRDRTTAILLRDFDGDLDLDLFAANASLPGGAMQDAFYDNDGTGTFTRRATMLPPDAGDALGAHALDLEGDGDLDILVIDRGGPRLLRNDGALGFGDVTANLPAAAVAGTETALVGDVDGDGDDDLTVLVGVSVRQLRNDGAGVFTHAAASDRQIELGSALLFDVDGDLDLDLVSPVGEVRDHGLWLNVGAGDWQAVPRDLPGTVFNQLDAAAVDLDGDGDLDVLAAGTGSDGNAVYRNDDGAFESVSYGPFTTDTAESMGIAVGDLDADGFADAVLANYVLPPFLPAPSQLYRNDGQGSLNPVATPPIGAISVALGDLDGDGDLDVYLGTPGTLFAGARDRVLLNQGSFVFTELPNAVVDTDTTTSVTLRDVDADGDLDAVLVGWFGGPDRVLRNDGTGVFTAAPGALPAVLEDSQHVVAADFDGDGDDDLVVANDGGGVPEANRFYRNDGTGTFVDSSGDLPGPNGRTLAFTAGDFDQDGDIDLLEAQFHSPVPTRLLQNDGLGHFSVVAGGVPPLTDYAHRFVTGDFDGDQDLDAFLVSLGPPHVLWNARRQLSWRALPRVGRPLDLDLRADPSTPFLLGAALLRGNAPIPGLGVLRLDVATTFVTVFGVLDAQGRATVSLAVPPDPALVGSTIVWQAVSGTPPLLGNLERTTFGRP